MPQVEEPRPAQLALAVAHGVDEHVPVQRRVGEPALDAPNVITTRRPEAMKRSAQ